MMELPRLLVLGGVALIVLGLVLGLLGSVLPLGRLPGDLRFGSDNWSIYIPLATSLLLSLILSVIATIVLWLLNR